MAGKALSKIWPTLALGNELSSSWLSRDAKVGEAYDKDPLVFKTITTRWYTEMLAAVERVHATHYSLPIGLFYSLTDPITDAAAAKALVERNGGMTKEYPGMLHEIFNEIGKEQVLADLVAWLDG
jgi:alpha-beta hydrolase superfamily lysophospholipase